MAAFQERVRGREERKKGGEKKEKTATWGNATEVSPFLLEGSEPPFVCKKANLGRGGKLGRKREMVDPKRVSIPEGVCGERGKKTGKSCPKMKNR